MSSISRKLKQISELLDQVQEELDNPRMPEITYKYCSPTFTHIVKYEDGKPIECISTQKDYKFWKSGTKVIIQAYNGQYYIYQHDSANNKLKYNYSTAAYSPTLITKSVISDKYKTTVSRTDDGKLVNIDTVEYSKTFVNGVCTNYTNKINRTTKSYCDGKLWYYNNGDIPEYWLDNDINLVIADSKYTINGKIVAYDAQILAHVMQLLPEWPEKELPK